MSLQPPEDEVDQARQNGGQDDAGSDCADLTEAHLHLQSGGRRSISGYTRSCLRDNRRARRSGGSRWGRPRTMDDAQVKRALALRWKGKSVRAIAAELDVPRAMVGRALAAGAGG